MKQSNLGSFHYLLAQDQKQKHLSQGRGFESYLKFYCLALSKPVNLSKPHFSHLQNVNDNTCFKH